VLRWHRQGWRTYWRRRSSRRGKTGRQESARSKDSTAWRCSTSRRPIRLWADQR
jgi:hypothetical protein